MDFKSDYQTRDGLASLDLCTGKTVFILGANGSGKSSLMHRIYAMNHGRCRRISAHRQTWFSSNAQTLTPDQKLKTQEQIWQRDVGIQSRYLDTHPTQRADITIYDLIDAENVRARGVTKAMDDEDDARAKELLSNAAPVTVINNLLRQSNLPIELSINDSGQVLAKRDGSEPYSIAKLSDGERNAILIAADVLTADPDSLILIDEPERHLHRSIISPLLTQLFATRNDCGFVISTHDVMLPMDNLESETLLVRSCNYNGDNVVEWKADLLSSCDDIDEDLKRDILGARRKIIFVEGKEKSLDKAIYSLIFPGVSVIAKETCRDVEHSVSSLRNSEQFHWLQPFGIVDNDRRSDADLERLREAHIHALPVCAVEAVYYHPKMQRFVAEKLAQVTNQDLQKVLEDAKKSALVQISQREAHLVTYVVEKRLRERLFESLPRRKDIEGSDLTLVVLDTPRFVREECDVLAQTMQNEDLVSLVTKYPIRDTGALKEIATKLGFRGVTQYESAVRKAVIDDPDVFNFVRSLFGPLVNDLTQGD